jgi:tRNA dimethylallyltransferase
LSDTTDAEKARSAGGVVPVVGVVGPTGVGKTTLAEAVAHHLGGEIVSADSMQVYRGMDIGTAKPPVAERRVPYHCIDLVDPGEPYSAALFQRDARSAIAGIAVRGALPVICGGTGLYVRAALDDWEFPAGDVGSVSRGRYERLVTEIGAPGLHAVLAERDPASAALIHRNNTRRVVRALEMLDEGASYSSQSVDFSERRSVYDIALVGLTMDRAALYERIDARVDAMFADDLLGEVTRLLDAGYRTGLTAAQAIGYKELVPVVEDGADLQEAVVAIKQATRRYAKRQLTWFRADPRIRWLDATGVGSADALESALALLHTPPRS